MRIVNRDEFLALPTPFMYIKCDEYGNSVGELSINCGSEKNDWVLNSCVFEPEFNNSGERFDTLGNMMSNHSLDVQVIDMNTTRDALYNEKQLFIIYSESDFKLFVETMQKYLAVYGKNEDIDYISD